MNQVHENKVDQTTCTAVIAAWSHAKQKRRWRAGVIGMLLTIPLLAACGSSPAQQRVQAGQALFEQKCKTEAGIKIYKTVEDVEGIVLLKVRPRAGETEWSDPVWPGAAFAREEAGDGYINTFLGYEQAFGSPPSAWRSITPSSRGFINTTYSPQNPFNLPRYRYVDVVDAVTGKRERFTGAVYGCDEGRWQEGRECARCAVQHAT